MQKSKVLVIKSQLHSKIVDLSVKIAIERLDKEKNLLLEEIEVPTVFEIANVINIGFESSEYDGVIVLGCIIVDANDKNKYEKYMAKESLRAINEVSLSHYVPLGYGIVYAHTIEEAMEKALVKGEYAANACLSLMRIVDKFIEKYDGSRPQIS